jgi:hypothetical protein
MSSSLLVYGVVIMMVQPPPAGSEAGRMVLPLYAVALVMVAVSVGWRFLMLTPNRIADRGPKGTAGAFGAETSDESALAGAFLHWHVHHIVAWALSESVAIFGLVLAFLSGRATHYWTLAAISLALFVLVHPPTTQRLETMLETVERRIRGTHD